jgi:hypothetical protein
MDTTTVIQWSMINLQLYVVIKNFELLQFAFSLWLFDTDINGHWSFLVRANTIISTYTNCDGTDSWESSLSINIDSSPEMWVKFTNSYRVMVFFNWVAAFIPFMIHYRLSYLYKLKNTLLSSLFILFLLFNYELLPDQKPHFLFWHTLLDFCLFFIMKIALHNVYAHINLVSFFSEAAQPLEYATISFMRNFEQCTFNTSSMYFKPTMHPATCLTKPTFMIIFLWFTLDQHYSFLTYYWYANYMQILFFL